MGVLASPSACTVPAPPSSRASETTHPTRHNVAWVGPRCAGVQSCVLGRVTASENARPLSQAAIFLERQDKGSESLLLLAVTDDEGIFTVVDPPPGRYRVAVYKDARKVEVGGVRLGGPGTTLLPVVLAP